MAEMRRLNLADLLVFVLILAVAAGARFWYLRECADNANNSGPLRMQDQRPPLAELPKDTTFRDREKPTELDELTHNLKENQWFGSLAPFANQEEKTAHVSPGYAWVLSLVARTQGDADATDRMMRWIQCGLGAVTAGLYFLIGVLAFRSRLVGLLAGLLCAAHPFWIIDTATIGDGVLATFLLSACLFLGTRSGLSGGAITSLLYGLALAGLALVRAALLPFAFAALLWFLWRSRNLRRGWLCALLSVLGFVNGLAPWSVRNWQTFEDVVPITNTTFLHVWMGNNAHATGGPMTEADMLAAIAEQKGESDLKAVKDELASKGQNERYRQFAQETWDVVREDPAACLRRKLWAGLSFFFGEAFLRDPQHWAAVDVWNPKPTSAAKPADTEEEDAPKPALPDWLAESLPTILFGTLLGMLLLGVIGWRWTHAWRQESRLLAVATLWLPLPYLLSHADWLSGPRLPLDGVLLTYAAFVLACLVPPVGFALFRGPAAVEEEERVSRRLVEGGRYGDR
jgi:4-amino-4-deoxy-L-arabinose transferase-like glycosyltransferase